MIPEYEKISCEVHDVNEDSFMNTYLQMQTQHGEEKMKEVALSDEAKALFGENLGDKLAAFVTNHLFERKAKALERQSQQEAFNERQTARSGTLK